jgi:hypothetical protein
MNMTALTTAAIEATREKWKKQKAPQGTTAAGTYKVFKPHHIA